MYFAQSETINFAQQNDILRLRVRNSTIFAHAIFSFFLEKSPKKLIFTGTSTAGTIFIFFYRKKRKKKKNPLVPGDNEATSYGITNTTNKKNN